MALERRWKPFRSSFTVKSNFRFFAATLMMEPPIHFVQSIDKLSKSLSAFQRSFTELQPHIVSFQIYIDSLLPPVITATASALATSSSPAPKPQPSSESDPSEEDDDDEEEKDEDEVDEEEEIVKPPPRSELENLCETMSSSSVRKYIITHLSDKTRLREQVPKALKLSPNPARLALECVGKLFPPMKMTREASIFVLECFLLMGMDEGVEIDESVKGEAEQAASMWRKRLIVEGGIGKADEMDARGLLLLIACFGIPGEFRNEDIGYLIRVCNLTEISGALKRSNVLASKIAEIIEGMVKEQMEVHAVDLAYTFGIEDRFNPQKLLKTFLRRAKKAGKKSQGPLTSQSDAKWKQLSTLQSVINCSKRNNIDPSKLLPGFHINEEIIKLEKDIAELAKQRSVQKRKANETEPSKKLSNEEMKRSRIPPPETQHQRVVNHVDNSTLLAGQTTAVLHEPVVGPRHENVVGSLVGIVGGAGRSTGADVFHEGHSYAGGVGRALVETVPAQVTGQLYGRPSDAAVYDSLASRSYAYTPSVYLEGSKGLPNTVPVYAYRHPPSGLIPLYSGGLPNTISTDAYTAPPLGLPKTIPGDVYRPPSYMEGSTGLSPTVPSDIAGRSSASDTYKVADTIAASILHRSSGSRTVDSVQTPASAHPSSYLYRPR